MGDDAASRSSTGADGLRVRQLPFAEVRRADVVGEVADVEYRRIRIQRTKGSRVRLLYLKVADGVPVEMIDGNGAIVDSPRIPEDKLDRIMACEVWAGVGTSWTPQPCRAQTYEQAKRHPGARRRR